MKRALALLAIPLVFACAGKDAPVQTADNAGAQDPPAEPPPTNDTPDAQAAGTEDGAWEGEAQAKNEKAPDAASGNAETRTMEVIAQIVKDNRKPVRECFDKAKKDIPDLAGDMTIHFVVDPDGKVKKAELNQERSTLKSPAVVDCAVKVIQAIKFPPSSRGMDTTVNYPFNFK
jgi:TonB family protein